MSPFSCAHCKVGQGRSLRREKLSFGKTHFFGASTREVLLVETRLETIAVVAAIEVSEVSRRKQSPWESVIVLDNERMEALTNVSKSLDVWNGFPGRAWHTGISLSSILPYEATSSLDRKIPARRIHDRRAIMASDASNFAVALYLVEGLPNFSFSEALLEPERGESSKKILAKGWGKLKITRLVLRILKKGRELNYDIQPIWVSRDNPFLQKADCLSKGIDSNKREIASADYAHLEARLGPFSVDLFATCLNAKCSRFYSRSFEDGTVGVDAFAQSWEGECAYIAPLVSLIMLTICKAALAKMNGILIVPLWKGAKFWTFAYRDGVHLNGLFAEMHLVRMTTLSWDISPIDRTGGK
jgi:hypothetical protein